MAVANVGSKWVDGNLIFFSKLDGQELLILDADGEITIPTGATFDSEDGAITVTEPDDVSLEVGLDGKLSIKSQTAIDSLDKTINSVTDQDVQDIADKVDAILAALRLAKVIEAGA